MSRRDLFLLACLAALSLLLVPAAQALAAGTSPEPQALGKIAFVKRTGVGANTDELFTMNGDGSSPAQLTTNTFIDRDPAFSPDATRIAFQRNLATPNEYDIWVMNADGSGATNLTSDATDNEGPAWTPDGTRIAYVSERGTTMDDRIWAMNADGSSQTQLTFTPDNITDATPAWSPDGQ